jgi:TatD DNase family protein
MLIDTHVHLETEDFDRDRKEVIKKAIDAGIGYILTVGSDLDGCRRAVELSKSEPIIYASVGIHPHEVKYINSETYGEIKTLAKGKKVVAYGEIGLDYHYDLSPRESQRKSFREQIEIAKDLKLPIIVHSREARNDILKILEESKAKEVGGIMHCFSGDIDMAKKAIDMGFYISIAGPVTFKKAERPKALVREIPIENILIETDSPYLAPEPFRGKRNEPSYLRYIAEAIAEIKGLSIEDVSRVTSYNAMKLLKIGKIEEEGVITYKIRDSLYLNITNRCTNHCDFCIRYYTDFVKGHNLRLKKEPALDEVIKAIGDPRSYKDIVFCGYGEPLIRLDLVKAVSIWVKNNGGKVRINTNGQGNLIHGRNILPELKGLVDSISISLNAHRADIYNEVCHPEFGEMTFDAMKDFIIEAKRYIPEVGITVLTLPKVDLKACEGMAKEWGVKFRVRELDIVG